MTMCRGVRDLDLGDLPPNLGPPSGKRGRGNLAVYLVQGMRSVHAGCLHRRAMHAYNNYTGS